MDYLPIFLNVKSQECVIVGGGEVAARKVEMLLRAGSKVTVIAKELGNSMLQMQDKINYLAGDFTEDLIKNPVLIYAATNDQSVNKRVYQIAVNKNIPINVVDTPDLCSFITPSIIDRSPVVAAISTAGASPVLARLIRTKLETLIPSAYGKLAEFAASYRQKVQQKIPSNKRREFWECIFKGNIPELIFSGKYNRAKDKFDKVLDNPEQVLNNHGEVYLVGAGPGDPDLLTFRALRLMQQADVVVHDRLISQAVLDLTRRDAEKIYVGKKRSIHTLEQGKINQLLVDLARSGKRVLRLKGGDPFIFGRGGEEIEQLTKANIPFRVVPGITAALGMSSYSGIPLTHRDYSQSVIFTTGHLKNQTHDLNWNVLAQPNQTVVFYMGLKGLSQICTQLIKHGMPKDTTAALVQKATTVEQKEIIGTLAELPNLVKTQSVQAPTLIVVGEVVKLHQKLKWFETKDRNEHEPRVF